MPVVDTSQARPPHRLSAQILFLFMLPMLLLGCTLWRECTASAADAARDQARLPAGAPLRPQPDAPPHRSVIVLLLSGMAVTAFSSLLGLRALRSAVPQADPTPAPEEHSTEKHDRIAALLEAIPDILYRIDHNGVCIDHRAKGKAYPFLTADECLGKNVADFLPPDVAELTLQAVRKALETRAVQSITYEIEIHDQRRYREARMVAQSDEEVVAIIRDITERKQIEEEQCKFSALIDHSTDFIAMATIEADITYINSAGRRMLGLDSRQDIAGVPLEAYFATAAWELVQQEVLPTVLTSDRWEGELELRHAVTGKPVYTQASLFLVRHPGTAAPMCIAMVQRDITQQKWLDVELQNNVVYIQDQNLELEWQKSELEKAVRQLNEANAKLEALATTDGLTGIHNHRAFQDRLSMEFKRDQRYTQPFSLILLDVDKFKQYNDAHGHLEGDGVLKQVAAVLKNTARETDFVARYGGEEFVILLPDTSADQALAAAERFRAAIAIQEWPLRAVTASVGVSTLTAEYTSPQELVDAADKALYASKQAGRNCVTHACARLAMFAT